MTDKLVYKPNDVMFIEIFLVDALTKQPITEINGLDLTHYSYISHFKVSVVYVY